MYYDALGVAKNFRKFFTFKILAFEKNGKLQLLMIALMAVGNGNKD